MELAMKAESLAKATLARMAMALWVAVKELNFIYHTGGI